MRVYEKIGLTLLAAFVTVLCSYAIINWIFEGTILNTTPVICVSVLPGIIAAIYTYKNLPELKED